VLDGTVPALQAVRHFLARRDFRARVPDPAPTVRSGPAWRERLAAGPLDELEALALLADYGIATLPATVVESADAAVDAAAAMGYPAVCKTAMPGILHKTEQDGIRLRLADAGAVRTAYQDLAQRLGPRVLVTRMAAPGVELALGLLNDRQFGPIVTVAAGGVLIELLRDARHGLAPFGVQTASRLLDGLTIRPLLDGVRGAKPVDRAAAALAIARFSVLAADLGDHIAECDVNPLILSPGGAVAVDALVIARRE
jgi:acyl-CoA synthetase (NDP forming)